MGSCDHERSEARNEVERVEGWAAVRAVARKRRGFCWDIRQPCVEKWH